jgi:tRNA A37 threonylcarbamoyladenosine dehydratase
MIREHERMSRQGGLISAGLRDATILQAGAGMLGSWTALALARVARSVHVWDPDVVEAVNVGTQAYDSPHIGLPKAYMLTDIARALPLTGHVGLFPTDELHLCDAVVSCVDSMSARRDIAKWAQAEDTLFVDSRVHGDVAVVLVVPPASIQRYLDSECPSDADTPEPECGMTGTAYVGMFVASQVVAKLNAYYAGIKAPFIEVTHVTSGQTFRKDYEQEAEHA